MNDRCLAGDYCVALTPDGSAITSQPLCHACVDRLQVQYDELPAILDFLPVFKGGMWGVTDEAHVSTGKSEAPTVLNVHCVDVIDLVKWVLEDVGSLRVSDLARHEDGVHRALLIGVAWKQADGIIGISPAWTRRFARCPECDTRSLGTFAGQNTIHCSNCGHTLTLDEYSAHIITVS